MIFNNPLIERYRMSVLRPRQVGIYTTIYLCVAVLIMLLNSQASRCITSREMCHNIFSQLLVVEILMFFLWAAYNSGSALYQEATNKTHDFFRMLPLGAYAKAAGILIGRNLATLLLTGINGLLVVLFGWLGGVTVNVLMQLVFVVIAGGVLINMVALLFSMFRIGTAKRSSVLVWMVMLFFVFPLLMGGMGVLLEDMNKLESTRAAFYGVELPLLVWVGLISCYFSLWVIKGIARRFTRETEPLFSRWGATFFLLGWEVVILGFFYPFFGQEDGAMLGFWAVSFLPVFLIVVGSLRGLDEYLAFSIEINRAGEGHKKRWGLWRYSNLWLGVKLFLMWALIAVGVNATCSRDQIPVLRQAYIAGVFFTSLFVVLLLVELYMIHRQDYNKIGVLLGFIGLLYFVLPMILMGVFEQEQIGYLSPLFFIGDLIFNGHKHANLVYHWVWIVNMGLCLVPWLLVALQYKQIVWARRQMENICTY